MIQATELRIGNWVSPIGDKPQQVRTIKEQAAKDGSFYTINGFLVEHLQPVALSPDILEKCGFVEAYKSSYSHRFELEKYPAFEYMMNSNGHIGGARYFGQVTGKVIYLHQLQNLYFALTDEELTLNL